MATVTLRPNGAGAETNCTASTGANWDCVDEASANDSDYVSAGNVEKRDLYTIESNSIPAGSTINSVTVHLRTQTV